MNGAAIGIFFEDDEVADKIEKAALLEYAANKRFEFERSSRRVKLTFDCAPDFEPFLIRSERADARFESIGDNCHFVVMH